MSTIHRRMHGKSMLKKAMGLKPPFARYRSELLVKLTMIPLRDKNNNHDALAILKPGKIGREAKQDSQTEGQSHIERVHPARGMTRMDDRDQERASTEKITTIQLNLIERDLDKRGNFTNALILTMNSMRDTTSSIVCQGDHALRRRHV